MRKTNSLPRTLGIIGGMGPLADSAFLDVLHTATDCLSDRGHIPVILDGNCLRPDRSAFILKRGAKSPQKSIIASMRFLEKHGADVIVMPCNTAHCFLSDLYKQKKRRTIIINMVYESARRCFDIGLKNVCVLCTAGTKRLDMFGNYFFNMGIDHVYPDKSTMSFISYFIDEVKCGKNPDICTLEEHIKDIPCDAFLLGCTELSYALHHSSGATLSYIDSLSCLARKTLSVFGKNARNIPYT